MGDSYVTIIVIIVGSILLLVFPLSAVAERNDDVAQLAVQKVVSDFVDDVRFTGKITEDKYNAFTKELSATGNSYDIEIERKVLDENMGKKSGFASQDKIGENVYYSVYTTQIEEELGANGKYLFKQGDMVSVSVKNTNKTIAGVIRNFFAMVAGDETYQVFATHSGIITTNGR